MVIKAQCYIYVIYVIYSVLNEQLNIYIFLIENLHVGD
jgi:hypothetical protein